MAGLGMFDLLSEELTIHRECPKEKEWGTDSTALMTEEESISEGSSLARGTFVVIRNGVSTPTQGWKANNQSIADTVATSIEHLVSDAGEGTVVCTDETSWKTRQQSKTRIKLSTVVQSLIRTESWKKLAKTQTYKIASAESEGDDEDSASISLKDSTEEARLNALVAEREREIEQEVDELITTVLVGFKDDEIEKELDNQMNTVNRAKCRSLDFVETAESLLAAMVDRLDGFIPCGNYQPDADDDDDDDSLQGLESVQSMVSERSDKGLNSSIPTILSNDLTDSETITSTGQETFLTLDDESLLSEYDDFQKAMIMLKNRAAHHRLSEVTLLERVRTEQLRRKSEGLTSTMVEI